MPFYEGGSSNERDIIEVDDLGLSVLQVVGIVADTHSENELEFRL